MELVIDFECPDCQSILTRKVLDLSPGTPKGCLRCGSPVVLTESGLRTLERRLEEYCRG